MASRDPGYELDSRGARRILAGAEVRRALRRAAEQRGVPAFKRAAPRRTGQFTGSVRVEDSTGWDGRPAVRMTVTDPGSLAIEFGTSRQRAANALQAAIVAIERG